MEKSVNKTKSKSEKEVKVAQLKGEKEFPVGEKVKGYGLLTEQGIFTFTPSGKIDPEEYNGMALLKEGTTAYGKWSICHSKQKLRLSVTIPKASVKVMSDALRLNNLDAICWFVGNYK